MVNVSPADHLEHHAIGELMDAVEHKNVGAFRSAMEALVMNMFEDSDGKA